MSFNLYLVRHGETYFNKYQRMQGWGNAPLTDKGISDGFAAGERLSNVRFDAAYSSDLQRAIHTAEFILGRNTQSGDLKTPEQLQQFREQFFGFFEGLPSASSAEQIAGIIGLENITSYGDLMSQLTQDAATFWARAENGLDILRQNTRDGQNVLVVAHGTMIRNLVYKYDSHETAKEKPLNGSISVWEVSDDDMKLKAYNDTTTNW